MQTYSLLSIPESRWANGLGSTKVIAVFPPNATFDTFAWRISAATLAADGPFSVLNGVDRSIALISGPGVTLSMSSPSPLLSDEEKDSKSLLTVAVHQLTELAVPFSFRGEAAVQGTLVRPCSSSTDFNVMSRRSAGVGHELRSVTLSSNGCARTSLVGRPECVAWCVHVVQGTAAVCQESCEEVVVGEGQGCVLLVAPRSSDASAVIEVCLHGSERASVLLLVVEIFQTPLR